jgi:hypothetical protein
MSDPRAAAVLRKDGVYDVLGTAPAQAAVPATPTADFTSYSAMSAAIHGKRLPVGTRAVLYDPEHWAYTPLVEQRNVFAYERMAATLAHQHGLRLILSPALDLVAVSSPPVMGPFWQQFLRLHLAGQAAAAGADVVVVQAQSLEDFPATYAAFVSQASAQVKAVNRGVVILAGLSTGPTGVQVGPRTIPAAERAVAGAPVSGFWLNVPGESAKCSECTVAPQSYAVGALVG